MTTQTLIETITTYGAIILAIFLIIERYRLGTSGLTREIVNDYKIRNEQLDKRIKEMDEKINLQGKDIAHLTGVISEKDKHIESLTNILQNRNPELVDLMNEIKTSNVEVKNYMKASIEHFGTVTKMLKDQSGTLEELKKRNDTIDSAHGIAVKH